MIRRLTFRNRLVGVAWVQLLRRSPVNLRRLLGVPKGRNPKGIGLLLASYAARYGMRGAPADLEQAVFCAEWLRRNRSSGYSGACWGYNFDWPNRGFFAPAGLPTVVNTAFIGLAFLRAESLVPDAAAIARSACEFVTRDLHRIAGGQDEFCFSYTPIDRRPIHNANVLGAQLLAEVSARTRDEPGFAGLALSAARYTARRQQPDGSWRYGIGATDGWIDNFHTAFVLVALDRLSACLGTDEFDAVVERGYEFWKRRLFTREGLPKYYAGRLYPIDVHCIAQAMVTFAHFATRDAAALDQARRLAEWAVEGMQDRAGYFYYQMHRHYVNRVPYMRWSQAWMFHALTELTCARDAAARSPQHAVAAAAPTEM